MQSGRAEFCNLATWPLLSILVGGSCAHPVLAADRLVFRVSSTQPAGETVRTQGTVLRDIFDPCLGFHWQLRVDPLDPDGPRRMVLLNPNHLHPLRETGAASGVAVQLASIPGTSFSTPSLSINSRQREARDSAEGSGQLAPVMVIRTGDRIIVEQDSEFVHARFEAVALEPAVAGQRLRARLSTSTVLDLSAPILSVVAVRAGEARWLSSAGGGR